MKKLPSSLHLHDHLHSSSKSRRNSPSLPAPKALNSKSVAKMTTAASSSPSSF
jgi:hypothetical protein